MCTIINRTWTCTNNRTCTINRACTINKTCTCTINRMHTINKKCTINGTCIINSAGTIVNKIDYSFIWDWSWLVIFTDDSVYFNIKPHHSHN